MWISTREAADRMGRIGLDRETARRALVAGVAGEPLRTRAAHLYETDRIEHVIATATTPIASLPQCCLSGVFVGRLSLRRPTPEDQWREWRGADLTAPLSQQRLAAAGWWLMSPITAAVLSVRAEAHGFVPFIGSVSGLGGVGAEIVAVHTQARARRAAQVRFELRPAGSWFDQLAGRRLGGPAGSPWYQWPRGMFGKDTWAPLATIEQ